MGLGQRCGGDSPEAHAHALAPELAARCGIEAPPPDPEPSPTVSAFPPTHDCERAAREQRLKTEARAKAAAARAQARPR